MDINDYKTDNIIEQLYSHKPQLTHPTDLTDKIMSVLPQKTRQTTPALKWVRLISATAAVLLICLFCVQQNESGPLTAFVNDKSVNFTLTNFSELKHHNELNTETSPLILYQSHLQHNSLKNKKLYSISQLFN
jgi:hypothetical protein